MFITSKEIKELFKKQDPEFYKLYTGQPPKLIGAIPKFIREAEQILNYESKRAKRIILTIPGNTVTLMEPLPTAGDVAHTTKSNDNNDN